MYPKLKPHARTVSNDARCTNLVPSPPSKVNMAGNANNGTKSAGKYVSMFVCQILLSNLETFGQYFLKIFGESKTLKIVMHKQKQIAKNTYAKNVDVLSKLAR